MDDFHTAVFKVRYFVEPSFKTLEVLIIFNLSQSFACDSQQSALLTQQLMKIVCYHMKKG